MPRSSPTTLFSPPTCNMTSENLAPQRPHALGHGFLTPCLTSSSNPRNLLVRSKRIGFLPVSVWPSEPGVVSKSSIRSLGTIVAERSISPFSSLFAPEMLPNFLSQAVPLARFFFVSLVGLSFFSFSLTQQQGERHCGMLQVKQARQSRPKSDCYYPTLVSWTGRSRPMLRRKRDRHLDQMKGE
ncbi:uncharacterized protein BP01DRAFT_59293 [Aspergillus saccharolyticus JOP 1030-1]|uniref:Uncharacterized protein n=1 Tax=Aspergillus saccharolyticus JOP 1030-1 TaxID=1450539 RepID=A0A319ADF1_9EURO|nr:hypothetical protein BP01DRAFT_59293 [Aspergillus saccharolyticus JOP 1030-1]PYH44882.1 hypothetical protein BP01DRAFT_59293 [Aspergillus saccharolyticus JOP 1030-1]